MTTHSLYSPNQPSLDVSGSAEQSNTQPEILKTRSPIIHDTIPVKPIQSPVKVSAKWDGWPDGDWQQDFTNEEYYELGELPVHWAMAVTGGDRNRLANSPDVLHGKRTMRKCLGIIRCENSNCNRIIRPKTRKKTILAQLEKGCKCGSDLYHVTCDITSVLIHWQDGVRYINGGTHTYAHLPHLLHLLPDEHKQIDKIIQDHPSLGPLQLAVGIPGFNGPGQSIADISPIGLNTDRIGKLKSNSRISQVGGNSGGITSSLDRFATFQRSHPNFIRYNQIGAITVIVMQTVWMQLQIQHDIIQHEPVHGFVTDAAHGF